MKKPVSKALKTAEIWEIQKRLDLSEEEAIVIKLLANCPYCDNTHSRQMCVDDENSPAWAQCVDCGEFEELTN